MRHRVFAAALAALNGGAAPAQDIMSGGINESWGSTQLLLTPEKHAWAAPECIDGTCWSVDCKGSPPPR